jgi:hypothetical protein
MSERSHWESAMTPNLVKAEKPAREPPPRKRKTQDELLDEALEGTFPASDPVAIIQPAPAAEGHENP